MPADQLLQQLVINMTRRESMLKQSYRERFIRELMQLAECIEDNNYSVVTLELAIDRFKSFAYAITLGINKMNKFKGKDYHVCFIGKYWTVKRSSTNRASRCFIFYESALEYANKMAIKNKSWVWVYDEYSSKRVHFGVNYSEEVPQ